jgi:dihydropteroate synthase
MSLKDTFFSKKRFLNVKGKLVELTEPIVMGIINVTPDSFYSGSRFNCEKEIINKAQEILNEGGFIFDIGAYSSRPHAENISEDTEKERLALSLAAIKKEFPDAIISLDTFRSSIAEWAVSTYGVDIINDISGGSLDSKMFTVIAKLKIPYILMHMRGTPQNMQKMAVYKNTTKEVISELSVKLRELKDLGVNDIIIDPGFGFGKSIENNFEILNNLDMFQMFDLPLLVGISRKSMIYKTLNISPEEALNGTTVIHTIALLKDVDILRVHDVKQAVEAIKLIQRFKHD